MTSLIDTSIPPPINPTTSGVRANFSQAKTEIETLQSDIETVATDLLNSILFYKATVTLTASEIKNLLATPITLVPAQGAGKVINVISTIAYTNSGSVLYGTSSTNVVMGYRGTPATNVVVTRIPSLLKTTPTGHAFHSPIIPLAVGMINTDFIIGVTGANFVTGNYTMKIVTYYSVVTL